MNKKEIPYGEVNVNYGLTDVTVKLDEYIYPSQLEVEDEMPEM